MEDIVEHVMESNDEVAEMDVIEVFAFMYRNIEEQFPDFEFEDFVFEQVEIPGQGYGYANFYRMTVNPENGLHRFSLEV